MRMKVVYTVLFERWLRRLRDQRAKASVLTRIRRIGEENFGDHRPVGGEVSELRIHVGQGYRVYYVIRHRTVVILLCGGDKSSQKNDIARARRLAGELDNGF